MPFLWAKAIRSLLPTLAKKMKFYGRKESVMAKRGQGLFSPPITQVEKMYYWGEKHDWGICEDDFSKAEMAIASLPQSTGPWTAPVLVPYIGAIGETFNALLEVFSSLYSKERATPFFKSSMKHLGLRQGVQHPSGPRLRWEMIDLGAFHTPEGNLCPQQMRGTNFAHAGVLAAANTSPQWVRAIREGNAPNVLLLGYKLRIRGEGEWGEILCIYPQLRTKEIMMEVEWRDHLFPGFAAPTIERVWELTT